MRHIDKKSFFPVACTLAFMGCATATNVGSLETTSSVTASSSGGMATTGGMAGTGGMEGTTSGSTGGGGVNEPPLTDFGGHVPEPACGFTCGATELCDNAHLGIDDNCDGLVDEGCACAPGLAHACFAGDPTKRGLPGCYDGEEICDGSGVWGPCEGGNHATSACDIAPSACAGLEMAPYVPADLHSALGAFGADAVAEQFDVTGCPPGIPVCPSLSGPMPLHLFQPQSLGDYTIKYTKQKPGGATESCEFPVHVKTRGLRAEVFVQAVSDIPFSLVATPWPLLHEPGTTQAWTSPAHVCSTDTCGFSAFENSTMVNWFDGQAVPPAPVNWYTAPLLADDSCYYTDAENYPYTKWKTLAMGCHDPLYERGISLGSCDCGKRDAAAPDFCGGEVVVLHSPPRGTWHRLAVSLDYGDNKTRLPILRIECNGKPAALLGPHGYGVPEAPLEFAADAKGVWVAADVLFPENDCDGACVVSPIYADAASRSPLVVMNGEFGPAYPPIP